jgi:hypothetical protein
MHAQRSERCRYFLPEIARYYLTSTVELDQCKFCVQAECSCLNLKDECLLIIWLYQLKKDVLVRLLTERFVPEDVPLFGSATVLDWVNAHAFSEESLSLDEVLLNINLM